MPEPVKASFWYTVCNFLQKGMVLLATPIFTRLMTSAQYGEYSIFMSWYNILMIFSGLNLFLGSYNKGLVAFSDRERQFTSSQLGLCTALTTLLLLIYFADVPFWTGVLEMSPALMAAMFLLLYAAPATEFWAARERFSYRYKGYVAITLATTALSMLTGVAAVLCTWHKTQARVYTDVLTKAAFGLSLYGVVMAGGKRFFHKEFWKYGLAFNLPLIPHFLSTFVLNQADRLMIGSMVGSDAAGVYSVAYTVSTVILLIVNAINNSLVPYVYKAIGSGDQDKVAGRTRALLVLVGALCVLTMCFVPEVILLFAGREYYQAIWVIPPIAASVYFIFVYNLYSAASYYFRKTAAIAAASVTAAVANLVLNYLFIPIFGYYAAGYTTLACYILLAAFHFLLCRRVWRQEMPGAKPLHDGKAALLLGLAVLAVMVALVLTYEALWLRYTLVLLLLLTAFLFRKRLTALLKP